MEPEVLDLFQMLIFISLFLETVNLFIKRKIGGIVLNSYGNIIYNFHFHIHKLAFYYFLLSKKQIYPENNLLKYFRSTFVFVEFGRITGFILQTILPKKYKDKLKEEQKKLDEENDKKNELSKTEGDKFKPIIYIINVSLCIIKTYFIIKLYANCWANKSAKKFLRSSSLFIGEEAVEFKKNSNEIHCKNNGVYNIINISHQNIMFLSSILLSMLFNKYDKNFENSSFSFINKNQAGFNDIFVIANYSLITPNICKFLISYLYKYSLKKRWQLKSLKNNA